MHRMTNRFSQIYHQIIKRKAPHAILSWRYLLPKQNHMVYLHRRVFLQAWGSYPRVVWCLIALYSFTLWYLFHSWREVFRAWKKFSPALLDQAHISRSRQALDLAMLAIFHSTPPAFYYSYHLYRYPEKKWLNFIYTHELPHWHAVLSPNISARSKHLMAHKQDFALEMAAQGLPSIPVFFEKRQDEIIPKEHLFNQQSVFIKPDCGSRKEGCYALCYRPETREYRLQGDNDVNISNQEKILSFVDSHTRSKHYLLQPLLENNALLTLHFQTNELIVMRLATSIRKGVPKIICAELQVPVESQFCVVDSFTVDIKNGSLREEGPYLMATKIPAQRLKSLSRFDVPLWLEMVSSAEKAHQSFLDIQSIGWDLAITPDGIKIIEGNLNWGVAVHQRQGYVLQMEAADHFQV
jgi:hypothetical protein